MMNIRSRQCNREIFLNFLFPPIFILPTRNVTANSDSTRECSPLSSEESSHSVSSNRSFYPSACPSPLSHSTLSQWVPRVLECVLEFCCLSLCRELVWVPPFRFWLGSFSPLWPIFICPFCVLSWWLWVLCFPSSEC
jgi:hypothetical protein